MLNSITCDTDPSEIISQSDVSAYLEALDEGITNYETTMKNTIVGEQNSAGLSTQAYSIDNKSTLQDKSNKILDNNKIASDCASLKSEVTEKLTEQRIKEINKLMEKIVEKIEELQNQHQEVCNAILQLMQDVTHPDVSSYVQAREQLETDIEYYQQKLETVKGMS